MRRAAYPFALLLSASGAPAAAPDPCALLSRAAIEQATHAHVGALRMVDSDLERTCLVTLQAGATTGRLRVSAFTRTPATLESGMTLQPLDKLLPVSEIGDEAVINTNANEIKFRVATTWYLLRTKAAPCRGDPVHDDDSVRIACSVRRNKMLNALAHALVRGLAP